MSVQASVIIPVWNGVSYISDCLDALLKQTHSDWEIIVVDNASTDGSADFVAQRYPQVRLMRNQANLGFSGGCNVGIKAARGDVLILLNQDTCVAPDWLETLCAAVQEPEIGIVGCKVLYPDGQTIQHAGGGFEWPLALAHHYGQGERDDGQWDIPRQVEYVTGAAMAFRRSLVEHIGMLDEGFWPGYFEDGDYCLRASEAGYRIWYAPQAILVHQETSSITNKAAVGRAYDRGRLRFLLKHIPPQRFLDEFIPAERAYQLHVAKSPQNPLCMAYLETIPIAAALLVQYWHADIETIDQVLLALQQLYRRPDRASMSMIPPLEEFTFQSTVPVVGPLLAKLRSMWYSVAARWAVRHLIQQQEFINQQQDVYLRSLIGLSREMARLAIQLESRTREKENE